MQLISKFNKEFRFLLSFIDIYCEYDKKRGRVTNAFQKILDESNRKPKNISKKSSESYTRSKKYWLEKSGIEMYLTYNERKSVIVERFIRALKNKIYKYMTSISKNVFTDKLGDIIIHFIVQFKRILFM